MPKIKETSHQQMFVAGLNMANDELVKQLEK